MTARAAAALLALALTGCADPASVGQDSPSPSPSASASPLPAGAVVLRVSHRGGLLPPGTVPDLPFWSLYADGRVITRGPEPAIFPGQAMPNIRVGTVTDDTVGRIAAAARAAGVDGVPRDYGDPPIADASTTVFRLTDDHGTVETAVYALSEASSDGGNEARRKLADFLRRLTAAESDGGFGAVSDDEAYEPSAVAVYARPYQPHGGGIKEQELAWHGPDPAAGEQTDAGPCTLLTGAALAAALPDLRRATTITRWTYDGKDWGFQLRPLLPDERTCADGLT